MEQLICTHYKSVLRSVLQFPLHSDGNDTNGSWVEITVPEYYAVL